MALIPYDDRDGFIYMDGKMLPWREAQIHVLTHALHYGSCVFEGERAYNGKIFKSRQHSERLVKSAQILGMDMPMSVDEMEAVKLEVMKANNVTDGYMRVVAWRGAEQMGISAQATKTHIAFCTWEWPSYFSPEKRENGIRLKTGPWKRPAPDTAPTQAKAAGLYMICTISKHAVEKEGYDDALMLDYRGFVAEATGANIFLIKDGEVHTPPTDCFLNGITRQTLIQLCKDHGITLHERHIKPEELPGFQECFLTGTAAEVTAVGSIDEHKFTVGPVVRKLRDAYEALVRA
ncbi:MAG TPA: branched-chain amino acid aminotransferase [Alphaproteobacteria bacterium]|nr:branched-chain amino acid aminotransferase [Alphaproteobacteria bacterium]